MRSIHMPYIKQDQREGLDDAIETLAAQIQNLSQGDLDQAAGMVNYSCTRLVLRVVKLSGKKFNYATLALMTGVFSNIQSEFYRRKGAPYEDLKVAENGDLDWD